MKLDFRSQVDISSHFADWLDKLLEPDMGDRFTDPATASTALKSKQAICANNSSVINRDRSIGDRISLSNPIDKNSLEVQIASRGAGCFNYLLMLLGIVWSFVSLPLFLESGEIALILMGVAGIVSFFISLYGIHYARVKKTTLKIDPQHFYLQWTQFSFGKRPVIKEIIGLTSDIDWVNLNIDKKKSRKNGTSITNTCAIYEGDRLHKFGLDYNLSLTEAEDVAQEVSVFLRQLRSRSEF